MAKNVLTEVSKDEEARAYYKSQLIFELDQRSRINHAKKEAQLEIAKEMLKDGMDISVISKYIKIAPEELRILLNS